MQINYEDALVRVGHTVLGPLDNNVYFVTCKRTGESMMIDAPSSAELLIEMCKRLDVRLVGETHGHWDHIGAVPELRAAGFSVAIGTGDADALPNGVDARLDGGETLVVGELRINTISTPGHTPGSICYAVAGAPLLFTGDTLFPGGPGATHFPGGDFDAIMTSLDALFGEFGDETVVLPGHGNTTTIGVERPQLPAWKQRRF
jgi:glyoxylase-like metal-dependent hydrolase (beta-lactamase superfamily II)